MQENAKTFKNGCCEANICNGLANVWCTLYNVWGSPVIIGLVLGIYVLNFIQTC